MRKGQVWHELHSNLISFVVGIHRSLCPWKIIMRKHDSLRHAGCSTCIDQCGTISWLSFVHSFLDALDIDPFPFFHEIIPMDNAASKLTNIGLWVIIKNDQRYHVGFKLSKILACILHVFSHNDLAFWVLSYKLTNLLAVGSINPGCYRPSEKTAKESNGPFRGIEPDNVDRAILRKLVGNQASCKLHC